MSRLFPMTLSTKSLKGSARESGSIRSLKRASRDSFPKEAERSVLTKERHVTNGCAVTRMVEAGGIEPPSEGLPAIATTRLVCDF